MCVIPESVPAANASITSTARAMASATLMRKIAPHPVRPASTALGRSVARRPLVAARSASGSSPVNRARSIPFRTGWADNEAVLQEVPIWMPKPGLPGDPGSRPGGNRCRGADNRPWSAATVAQLWPGSPTSLAGAGAKVSARSHGIVDQQTNRVRPLIASVEHDLERRAFRARWDNAPNLNDPFSVRSRRSLGPSEQQRPSGAGVSDARRTVVWGQRTRGGGRERRGLTRWFAGLFAVVETIGRSGAT